MGDPPYYAVGVADTIRNRAQTPRGLAPGSVSCVDGPLGAVSICCRGEATGAHQTPILHLAIVFGREDLGATLAFLLAADIAHDAIDGDGIAPFVELLNHDTILHRG